MLVLNNIFCFFKDSLKRELKQFKARSDIRNCSLSLVAKNLTSKFYVLWNFTSLELVRSLLQANASVSAEGSGVSLLGLLFSGKDGVSKTYSTLLCSSLKTTILSFTSDLKYVASIKNLQNLFWKWQLILSGFQESKLRGK